MIKYHTIYLDMDGPLANFHLEAVRAHLRVGRRFKWLTHHGTPTELKSSELFRQYPRGKSVGDLLRYAAAPTKEYWSPEMQEFWSPIEEDPFFWRNMEPMPYAKQLLDFLTPLCKSLVILTSPHFHPSSYGGKFEWLRRHNLIHLELITCHKKWRLVRPDALLVDDFEVHCNAWRDEGDKLFGSRGHSILFPAVWNEGYKEADAPVQYVQHSIEMLSTEQ